MSRRLTEERIARISLVTGETPVLSAVVRIVDEKITLV